MTGRSHVVVEVDLAGAAVVAQYERAKLRRLGSPEADEDGDRELEALRPVHGHDPEDVLVGLGQNGLDGPQSLPQLVVHPVGELDEAAPARRDEATQALGEEPHAPPSLAGAG